MGSMRYSCDMCNQNCFYKHWKKQGEPPKVCAFFKSMIDKEFDVYMVLPCIFSKKLASMIGTKFILEDAIGRKWDVFLTSRKGSLVFQQGWRHFALDHGIQANDFLAFYYLNDRHFLVEIYGSNACKKIVSSERINLNRTTETTRNSIPRKRFYVPVHEESASEKHFRSSFSGPSIDVTPSPENVHNEKEPVSEHLDDLFFMSPRDIDFAGEEDRGRPLDLSEFEKPVRKPTIDEEEDGDYRQDLAVFYLPESGNFRNAGTEAGHIDLPNYLATDRNPEVLSGLKMKRTNQEARPFKQDVYGTVMADNSLGASDSPSEQGYRNHQETSLRKMKVEGGTTRPMKQEARELKPDVSGDPMSGFPGADFFYGDEQKTINCLCEIVEPEPLNCIDPSEIADQVPCQVPPGTEDFLELPRLSPLNSP